MRRAVRYLGRQQNDDGSWLPLWFGNQQAPGAENRTYGTARVVLALRHGLKSPMYTQHPMTTGKKSKIANFAAAPSSNFKNLDIGYSCLSLMLERAGIWLLDNRNSDGGWGAVRGVTSSIEETGLAVQALAALRPAGDPAIENGLRWLEDRIAVAGAFSPAPIGLYFASLWYWEELYPIIFALGAFSAAGRIAVNTGSNKSTDKKRNLFYDRLSTTVFRC